MSKASATDIQQSITDQVIEILSSGEVPPWKKPWTGMGGAMPFNFSTNAPYNGVNILILWLAAMKMEYSSNAWMTRSEEHTSELQSRGHLVCRLLLEKKKTRE